MLGAERLLETPAFPTPPTHSFSTKRRGKQPSHPAGLPR